MTTDPVSAPAMPGARWVYGFMIGMLTVLIRVFNPAFPEGIGIVILFMNCFAPLLDEIQLKARLKKRIPNVQ
ncbi:MAG: RnfABCDGE type electron transport complex subunit D [Desulfobacterales bacterium]|nr:RnfABCDGE type electron transport complex subunit D [Desulfobacterales bacterium]